MRILPKGSKSFNMSGLLSRLGGKSSSLSIADPIDPGGLANIAARYIMNTGITSSGGFVSQWDDQSGNLRHLVQATGSKQPAVDGSGIITFDGADDSLQALFAITSPVTIYGVINLISITKSTTIVWDGGTDALRILKFTANANSQPYATTGYFDTSANFHTGRGFQAVGVTYNSTNSYIAVNHFTPFKGSTGSTAGARGGFTIGNNLSGTTLNPANISVKELIVFSAAHTAATMAGVNSYLMNTYGIT